MAATARQPPFLAEDPALPRLPAVWSPDGRLELFNGAVLPVAWPGRRAGAVTGFAAGAASGFDSGSGGARSSTTFVHRSLKPATNAITA